MYIRIYIFRAMMSYDVIHYRNSTPCLQFWMLGPTIPPPSPYPAPCARHGQYGYVTMFAVAFPLAPLLALIRCLAEIYIDHQKLLQCRRPAYIDRREMACLYSMIYQ